MCPTAQSLNHTLHWSPYIANLLQLSKCKVKTWIVGTALAMIMDTPQQSIYWNGEMEIPTTLYTW